MSRLGGMGGFGDIQKLMKQAQKAQEDAEKLQSELEHMEISAKSGSGMVEVTVNGHGHLVRVKINPAIVTEDDTELIEDLIVTAAKEAAQRAVTEQNDRMQAITGDLSSMKLPPGLF